MSDIRAEIGRRLSEIRQQKGLSQDELSKLSGVGQSHITRIENGRYNVGVDTVEKLASAMGSHLKLE